MSKKDKKRLDQKAQEQFEQYSRAQIQSWIMQGNILVDGQPITKPGTAITGDAKIILKTEPPKYVSRAGLKLEKALEHFAVDVNNLVILDAGLSTGGFADCLLRHGAKKVYGIDVGIAQVHEKIRQDPRVVVKEKTNLRTLTDVGELVDLITLDLSFISVLKVMDAVCTLLKPDGQLIVLIKPQFEAERRQVGKGGVIKDTSVHEQVIKKVTQGIVAYGFELVGVTDSPIKGGAGNKEFLAYFRRILK